MEIINKEKNVNCSFESEVTDPAKYYDNKNYNVGQSDLAKKTFDDLPEEVIEYIFYQLAPYSDLKNCSLVCTKWYAVVKGVVSKIKRNFEKALINFNVCWETVGPDPVNPPIAKRFSHAAVLVENSMFVFGGCTANSTTFNDLWCLNLNSRQWERPLTIGSYPSPKASATVVHYRRKLLLFGGWTHPSSFPIHQSYRLFDELHVYDVDENRWSIVVSTVSCPPRMAAHSATVQGNVMVVFGGLHAFNEMDTGTKSNSIWCLNMDTYAWHKQETTSLKPKERYGQSQLSLNDDNILILGGCGGPNTVFNDAWILTLTGPVWTWRQIVVQNPIYAAPQLWCHPACKVGNVAVVLSCSIASASRSMKKVGQWAWSQHEVDSWAPQRFQASVRRSSSNDRDQNVNGNHGVLRSASSSSEEDEPASSPSRSPRASAFLARQEPSRHNSTGSSPNHAIHIRENNQFSMAAFREPPPRPGREEARQRQLASLKRMEERLQNLAGPSRKQPEPSPETPLTRHKIRSVAVMFVLDISKALVNEGYVRWLRPQDVQGQEPEEMKLHSLIAGNGELIAFGGVRRETSVSYTQFQTTVSHTQFLLESLSNGLNFIRPNRTVI